MFENFKKITIKGGYFDADTPLEFFKDGVPLCVVYGRNGSGKTNVAKGFRELAHTNEERKKDEENGIQYEYTVTTTDAIPENLKHSIFVFDEDFVKDHVRVEDKEGLDTIVMLGEQVGLDEQIKLKEKDLEKINTELQVLADLKDKYKDQNNGISPNFHFLKIKSFLQSDGGWADIDRDVKENSTKSSVTPKMVEVFMAMPEPTETVEELKVQLKKDYDVYMNSDSSASIAWTDCTILCPDNLNELDQLLKEMVDKPDLNDREKRLLSFLTEHPQKDANCLVDEKWSFCPTCLREVTDEDRDYVSNTLIKLLNKRAEEYQQKLNVELAKFEPIVVTLPTFPNNLHQTERNQTLVSLTALNNLIKQVKDRLDDRKNRLYEVVSIGFKTEFAEKYARAIADFKANLAVMKQLVIDYNKLVADLGKLQTKVLDENKNLARKQITPMLAVYQQAITDANKNLEDWTTKDNNRKAIEAEIADLKTKKNNTALALDEINLQLQYVFYSDTKVQLEPGEGCYKLKVQGKDVLPHRISVGERNVLGLCYFFANIFQGMKPEEKYNGEYLLVIDDPVSSFDYGNRVGVMSLLRYQFCSIMEGDKHSRILVMTHDLHSAFDLAKMRNELCNLEGEKKFFELKNKALSPEKKHNEYKKLLDQVYEYAVNTKPEDPDEHKDTTIGNIMRRLLEAFASFNYNEGFEKMLRKKELLALIDEEKREYYKNFMFRLTLNSESHSEEAVYTLTDMTSFFTKKEKIQTAKSLLLFLLYVNKTHLEAYLMEKKKNDVTGEMEDDRSKIDKIESWKEQEKKWLLKAKNS